MDYRSSKKSSKEAPPSPLGDSYFKETCDNMLDVMEEEKPDAEITNPHTKRILLNALFEQADLNLTYVYDKKQDRLFVYLERG